jgi:hypothetical protein
VIAPLDPAPARVRVMSATCMKHGPTEYARFGGVQASKCCQPAEFRRITGGKAKVAVDLRGEKAAKVRPGERHEAALYAALNAERYMEASPGRYIGATNLVWLRQYPFGAFLSPPRRFTFDAAFPEAMVAVECDGGAHAAGKAKQRTDTERRGLAGANGWIVVAVTPEQVADGSALALVREALSNATRTPRPSGAGGEG